MADKEVMKAISDHCADRPSHLVDTFASTVTGPEANSVHSLATTLRVLADSFRAEADLWTASRSKGWQSTATRLREAAKLVGEVADGLDLLASEPATTTPVTPPREPVELGHMTNGQLVYRPEGDDGPTAVSERIVGESGDMAVELPPTGAVMAYLRGDTDVIPVSPMPGADLSQQASADAGGVSNLDLNAEAHTMTQTFPIPSGAMAGIVDGPYSVDFSEPKSVAAQFSRYTPSGGKPLSFADLMTPPAAHLVPDHWSWSQLETSEDCGLKYRATRIEQLTQIPQWANIGGDAFHKATESIDRASAEPGFSWEVSGELTGATWERCFTDAITTVASTSPVPIDKWRTSNQGKENQDWWRVEGEEMLRRFVENRAKLAAGANPRKLATLPHPNGSIHGSDDRNYALAIEWPFSITVDGPVGSLLYTGIVDRVWECSDGTLLIEDLKSGSKLPLDTAQLGSYAWAVRMNIGMHLEAPRIMGTFYNGRKGVWTPAVDLLVAHPWEELVYRLHSAEAKRRAGLYTPHVSNFCVACPVQYACPLRNRETGSAPS